ncbi:MAG: tetratricopeptide repeat protein [Candidatus Thorarchaeota archaeon]
MSLELMEPIGTITMYYPFLQHGIVHTLDTIMLEATDYHDFVVRLCQKVCTEDVPDTLTYLAAVHALNLASSEMKEKLVLRHGDNALVRALVTDDYRSRIAAIEEAMSRDLDNWIELELYYLNMINPDFRDHLTSLSSFDKARKLLEIDARLKCFEPLILTIQGTISRIEGNIQGAIRAFEEGLKIATEYDDRVRVTDVLLRLGNLTKDINAKESWDIFDRAHRSAKSIGYSYGIATALLEMGKVSYIRGEYDLGVQSLLEADNLFCSASLPKSPSVSINLTRIYCAIGNGEEALTCVETTISRTQSAFTWNYLQKAESLILLGKIREASEQLDLGKKEAMKEGREWELAKYYHVNGLYENALGNPLNALLSLEQSIEIIDRMNLGILKGACLLALARTEMCIQGTGCDSDTSGPWMSRLEEFARENDLPGMRMEHAMLKAEFQEGQGRIEAARKTLVDALSIYDSPSVKSLRNKIQKRISDLDLT